MSKTSYSSADSDFDRLCGDGCEITGNCYNDDCGCDEDDNYDKKPCPYGYNFPMCDDCDLYDCEYNPHNPHCCRPDRTPSDEDIERVFTFNYTKNVHTAILYLVSQVKKVFKYYALKFRRTFLTLDSHQRQIDHLKNKDRHMCPEGILKYQEIDTKLFGDEDRIKNNEEAIVKLQETDKTHTEEIDALRVQVENLLNVIQLDQDRISALESAMITAQNDILKHTNSIKNIDTSIINYGEAIKGLQRGIQNHEDRIIALERRVF